MSAGYRRRISAYGARPYRRSRGAAGGAGAAARRAAGRACNLIALFDVSYTIVRQRKHTDFDWTHFWAELRVASVVLLACFAAWLGAVSFVSGRPTHSGQLRSTGPCISNLILRIRSEVVVGHTADDRSSNIWFFSNVS